MRRKKHAARREGNRHGRAGKGIEMGEILRLPKSWIVQSANQAQVHDSDLGAIGAQIVLKVVARLTALLAP